MEGVGGDGGGVRIHSRPVRSRKTRRKSGRERIDLCRMMEEGLPRLVSVLAQGRYRKGQRGRPRRGGRKEKGRSMGCERAPLSIAMDSRGRAVGIKGKQLAYACVGASRNSLDCPLRTVLEAKGSSSTPFLLANKPTCVHT